jgi:nucleoside-diphosphate-sugar epimerase
MSKGKRQCSVTFGEAEHENFLFVDDMAQAVVFALETLPDYLYNVGQEKI